MADRHRLQSMHRGSAAGDLDSVTGPLTYPRKHGSRQRVGCGHPECPRFKTPSRGAADDLTEVDNVTCRAEPAPRVHTDDPRDADPVAGLLLRLARGGDRGVFTGLAVTARELPTRRPRPELQQDAPALDDRHLRPLDSPFNAVDGHDAHDSRCSRFGSPIKIGSTPGTTRWSKVSDAVPTVIAATRPTLPWVSGGGSSAARAASA